MITRTGRREVFKVLNVGDAAASTVSCGLNEEDSVDAHNNSSDSGMAGVSFILSSGIGTPQERADV